MINLPKVRGVPKRLASEKFNPQGYGFATLIGMVACLLSLQVDYFLGSEISYLFLITAVITSSWFFGFGPGLLTTELLAVSQLYFFRNPIQVIFFIAFGFIICLLAAWRMREEALLREREKYFRTIVDSEKEARLLAEEAVRERDEFLSIASHELKTPLTTVLLQLQSTLDTILNQSLASFSGERLVKSLTIAQQQSNRLQKLIKDLLNVSLITTGRLELELKQGDLSQIIQSTLTRFDDKLMLEGCTLNYNASGQLVGLWDEIRLEQAFSNLLTNAIKFGKGKPIDVSLERVDGMAKVIVSDHGIGIDPKYQKVIFERFKRAVSKEKFQGLGIGLFIVKQITEAHDGKVSVSSKPNQGSSFIIQLPIKN